MTRPLLVSFSLLVFGCDSASDTATETPADVPDTVAATPEQDTQPPPEDVGPDIAVTPDVPSGEPDVADSVEADDATAQEVDTFVIPEDWKATVVHSFGFRNVGPYGEQQPCVAWSLNNEQSLYVNGVTLSNDGGFHHSNWFVVPEDAFPGPDGFFKCGDRGFQEIGAAIEGTVIFAQSTQSLTETQQLPDGVVIKVPPKHKIIATTHLLNLSSDPLSSELRMSLDIIHPALVKDITTPFRLSYFDLRIDAKSEQHFTGECNFANPYGSTTGVPLDMKIYWVTPHYHYLGNYFRVGVLGGPSDGDTLHEIFSFDAEPHGKAFDPPIDLTGSDGLSFTCGYMNPTDKEVGWGVGDQEMCVMLGLASSKIMMDATVGGGTEIWSEADGITKKGGPCSAYGLPKHVLQTPPTPDDLAGDLYIPPSNAVDTGLDPVKECADTPADAVLSGAATLTNIRETIFAPACSFSACHGGPKPAMGLSLDAVDLHAELIAHKVLANTTLPLITAGDPDASWLYHLLSKCEPKDKDGAVVSLMPRNAPFLMKPELITRVRDWIKGGALND